MLSIVLLYTYIKYEYAGKSAIIYESLIYDTF